MNEPTIDCPLSITQQQYDEIAKCEAVVVREWERDDGTRFGEIIDWGDNSEMRDIADTPQILIVPLGIKSVGKVVVPVSQLIPEKDSNALP
jgi:hypothetical protein